MQWGNLDSKQENELPTNFDADNQYYVKLWKVMKLRDGQVVIDNRSVKFQAYDDLAFDQSFGTTIDKNKKESIPLIQKLGFQYQVLHNPNK